MQKMKHRSRDHDMSVGASRTISTPPPSFARPSTDQRLTTDTHKMESQDSIGRFSYGPATQTTVVTTTTTTTTDFPPLMMRAPRHLHDLDPKLYPLAASPTPSSIKKLSFELDGRMTTFLEADDTLEALGQVNEQEHALSQANGSLRSITNGPPHSPFEGVAATRPQSRRAAAKRSASPVSLSEAAHIATQEGPRKKRLTTELQQERMMLGQDERQSRTRDARVTMLQTSTPITPQVEEEAIARPQGFRDWQERRASGHDSLDSSATLSNSNSEDGPPFLSPKSDDDQGSNDGDRSPSLAPNFSHEWQIPRRGPVPTPQQGATLFQQDPIRTRRSGQRNRPQPQAVNIAAAQDASLPSPSLSPVTAAAQINARSQVTEYDARGYASRSGILQTTQQQPFRKIDTHERVPDSLSQSAGNSIALLNKSTSDAFRSPPRGSLMSIPHMIDDFESMPEDVKKYVIHHLLRRCSKPVLHFVSATVNPALKCDFLRYLPPELCEPIIAQLDMKSLCAAAQVSKKWRQQIDMSEKVWRRLFYEHGYTLQEGELNRAIREGWGWQTISDLGHAEKDLSLLPGETGDRLDSASPTQKGASTGTVRNKKKGKSKSKAVVKIARKRKYGSSSDGPEIDEDLLLGVTSAVDGPFAAAKAAAAAISLPRSDLHLWKSIFMRHHLIRQTWMQDRVAPRHIAFRAHEEHVVTCLQFDSDKILTGSDDANINVYDTQTGALRAKLEGHEGGVWALQYEGNVLVSGSTDRAVRVWDIERGICTHTFQGHTSTVRCLQILLPTLVGTGLDGRPITMPKQPLIITGSRDSHLRVWKLPKPGDAHLHQAGPAQDESTESRYFVRTLTGHHHSVRAIAAHADTLVSGSYDCTVRVWKISTGETLHRLQGHSQKVYSVVLDSKRNRCISGSMDNVVKVWSLETGICLFNLEGHQSLVGLLDLQQDRLVSAAADSTLRIWDPENGHCKSTLTAHTGAITCFQHDGQKVISGSDRTLKMWNVETGDFVRDLLTDLSGVWQVKFNERRCVAAVQRNSMTFIEVLDFGACRDGVPEDQRGRRILVDVEGRETTDIPDNVPAIDPVEVIVHV